MIPTADPDVLLEERRDGYWRYRRISNGERWEVRGVCDRRGHCLVGATLHGEFIRDLEHLSNLCARLGVLRPDSDLDVPVTTSFKGCCPFRYVVLDSV